MFEFPKFGIPLRDARTGNENERANTFARLHATIPLTRKHISHTISTMASHPETKIDCSKVYVKKSSFSNETSGEFDGAFAAVPIKKGMPFSPSKNCVTEIQQRFS